MEKDKKEINSERKYLVQEEEELRRKRKIYVEKENIRSRERENSYPP